jgi:hypothetical protein
VATVPATQLPEPTPVASELPEPTAPATQLPEPTPIAGPLPDPTGAAGELPEATVSEARKEPTWGQTKVFVDDAFFGANESPPGEGQQWPVIIGAGLGGLILLAALIALIVLFLKKKKKTSSSIEIRSTLSESVMLYETRLVMDTEVDQVTQDNPLQSFDGGAEPQTYLNSPLD